jgi:DNA polymerase
VEAMRRIEQAGLDIVGHVHDEVILEVPKAKYTVDDVCNVMNQNPAWADGLPLASDGYTGAYYFKS